MVSVVEVDPADEAALRAFWETEQAAQRHDRPDAVLRTWDFLHVSMTRPGEYYRHHLLAARNAAGETLGVADVGLSLRDNQHLCEVEINVVPEHRRRGIGSRLHAEVERLRRAAGRTTVLGEAHVPAGAERSASTAFAESLGFVSSHIEEHLVLRLPVPEDRVAVLRESAALATAYDVLTWGERCPDDLVEAFCALNTQMAADVPTGELDLEAVVWDEARLRTSEERLARSFASVTAVARRRSDGVLGGYSQVLLPLGETHVLQEDTLVMPAHRGHRLGTTLKVATLDVVQAEHPERAVIHTWTAVGNRPMLRTNTAFGYRAVERMHEMQRRDV